MRDAVWVWRRRGQRRNLGRGQPRSSFALALIHLCFSCASLLRTRVPSFLIHGADELPITRHSCVTLVAEVEVCTDSAYQSQTNSSSCLILHTGVKEPSLAAGWPPMAAPRPAMTGTGHRPSAGCVEAAVLAVLTIHSIMLVGRTVRRPPIFVNEPAQQPSTALWRPAPPPTA